MKKISNDMLNKKCRKCKKGKYYEWSMYCDRGNEPLKCDKCGHKKQRWTEKKITVDLEETVQKRLKRDKEFREGMLDEILVSLEDKDYEVAKKMLKSLITCYKNQS